MLNDCPIDRLDPLIRFCVWWWRQQQLRYLVVASRTPSPATLAEADLGHSPTSRHHCLSVTATPDTLRNKLLFLITPTLLVPPPPAVVLPIWLIMLILFISHWWRLVLLLFNNSLLLLLLSSIVTVVDWRLNDDDFRKAVFGRFSSTQFKDCIFEIALLKRLTSFPSS